MKKLALVFILALYSICIHSQTNPIDSISNILKTSTNDTNKVKVYLSLAEPLFKNNSDSALALCKSAIVICEKQLTNKNLSSQEKYFYKLNMAAALNGLGFISKVKGEITQAFELYHQAVVLFKEVNSSAELANTYNNLGVLYKSVGDIKKATDCYMLSIGICEKSDENKLLATTYNNLGLLYKELGNPEKAIEYYSKSLQLSRAAKQRGLEALAMNNLSMIYKMNKDTAKALEYLYEAAKIVEEIKDYSKAGLIYNNIGIIHMYKGESALAIEMYEKSISYYEKVKNKSGLSNVLNNMGVVYSKQNQTQKALNTCLMSLQLAKETGFPSEISNAAKSLKSLYQKLGQFKQAFEMQELYYQMRDSTQNKENQSLLLKNQFKYDYEKKVTADSIKMAGEKKTMQSEVIAKDAQIKQQKTQRFALFIGLALVIIFAWFMFNRFKITQKQSQIIEHQKKLVEVKQKEVMDSINYAKRIQYTLLAHEDFLKKYIPEHFVLYKPKDIVSGDFYWATTTGSAANKKFYLAVCDSTGHGVPGAFMSLLNISFLNEAINERGIEKPNEVFNYVRKKLIEHVSREGQQDGFDGILLCFDFDKKSVSYASANNSPIIIRDKEIMELSKDRMPVGIGQKEIPFELYSFAFPQKSDTIYLCTDGFADQFGGPKGKKFKYKQLNELLVSLAHLSMNAQKQKLDTVFEDWKGIQEQTDDVCVIGIKV